MSGEYIYVMKELGKSYPGGKQILSDVYLSFYPGAKIGIIGSNGAGKSTLLKIMAGLDKDFIGEAWAAKNATVGYLPQEPQLDPKLTVFENVMQALAETKAIVDEYEAISAKFAEEMSDDEMNALIEKQGELQEKIDQRDAWDLDRRVEIAMDALRCPPGDSDVTSLSGGEKRRVALCKLLLEKPDLLLLDEPTNHLDAQSVAWLEKHLQEYKGTIVLVTHDRYFLDNVISWILEVDRGQAIPFEGNYSAWLEAKQKRLRNEQKSDQAREKHISQELEWMRQSPKARQTKSKARIQAFEKLIDEANQSSYDEGSIVITPGERLGNVVLEVEGIHKSYGDKFLIENLSFNMPKGSIVGVIGPNGAGKSTLFRMLTQQEKQDSGDIRVGDSVHMAYVDQSRDALDDKRMVWEEIADGQDVVSMGKRTIPARAYCSLFNFKGASQQKTVGQLSGGERNRVHLAKILKSGANVLFLDEPTNDLDVETLRSLEEALLNFPGCVFVTSHDRFFLDRIATHILAFEGDSHVEWFEGNYQAYEADYKLRFGEDAAPHRVKYKPLER